MIVVHFIFSLFLWVFWILPVYLLGFQMVTIGLLFCREDSEHMPFIFWPWDNWTGINGTLFGQNPSWPRITNGKNRTYRYRWIWLAWRNPVSNWSRILAPVIKEGVVHTERRFWRFTYQTNRIEWFWDYAFSVRLTEAREAFFRFGWKLSEKPGRIAKMMFRVSPWKQIKQ